MRNIFLIVAFVGKIKLAKYIQYNFELTWIWQPYQLNRWSKHCRCQRLAPCCCLCNTRWSRLRWQVTVNYKLHSPSKTGHSSQSMRHCLAPTSYKLTSWIESNYFAVAFMSLAQLSATRAFYFYSCFQHSIFFFVDRITLCRCISLVTHQRPFKLYCGSFLTALSEWPEYHIQFTVFQ